MTNPMKPQTSEERTDDATGRLIEDVVYPSGDDLWHDGRFKVIDRPKLRTSVRNAIQAAVEAEQEAYRPLVEFADDLWETGRLRGIGAHASDRKHNVLGKLLHAIKARKP